MEAPALPSRRPHHYKSALPEKEKNTWQDTPNYILKLISADAEKTFKVEKTLLHKKTV